MSYANSEPDCSESKKEGLKYITQAVFQLLRENRACTYSFICKNIVFPNAETLNRRIYDVLNVMKAVKLVDKRGKRYFLAGGSDDVDRRREEAQKLMEMKKVFKFIVDRNSRSEDTHLDRLYLPFMIVSTNRRADVHCETNEERNFFAFKSSKPLRVDEDLDILREIYEKTHPAEEPVCISPGAGRAWKAPGRLEESSEQEECLDPDTFLFSF